MKEKEGKKRIAARLAADKSRCPLSVPLALDEVLRAGGKGFSRLPSVTFLFSLSLFAWRLGTDFLHPLSSACRSRRDDHGSSRLAGPEYFPLLSQRCCVCPLDWIGLRFVHTSSR